MRIGVDFDNTIVCFDPLFHSAAVHQKLLPATAPVTKNGVRDALRALGKEEEWTRLQGHIYGEMITKAKAFAGAIDFFARAQRKGHDLFIVSHKSETSAMPPFHDLHVAAHAWLDQQQFFEQTRLGLARVYFEVTMEKKLERIRQLECEVVIDDLLEFLARPDFPEGVRRILFDPHKQHADSPFERVTSWKEAMTRLLS